MNRSTSLTAPSRQTSGKGRWSYPDRVDSSRASVPGGRLRPGDDPTGRHPVRTSWRPLTYIEVKRARTGHVLVRPKVDGLDLGWFIFDTGAGGTILDPKAATKLKLEPVGAETVTSFLGTVPSSILRAASLELGSMTVSRPFFMTMDLAFLRDAMGEPIVGIIGYDILSRSIAEITLADDSIKLHDPKVYRLDSAIWRKLTFNQSLPVVSATFEGHREGLFRIDVCASGPGVGHVIFPHALRHCGRSAPPRRTPSSTRAPRSGRPRSLHRAGGNGLVRAGRASV